MKTFYLLIILIFFGDVSAQFPVDSLQEIDSAKNFNDSLEQYLALITDGSHSPEVYANLGYIYYQQKDLARAVLYYEKAAKLKPHDPDLSLALAKIKSELPVQITVIPDFVLLRIYQSFYNYCSATMWSIVQLCSAIVLLILLYQWLFHASSMKATLQWSLFSVLLFITILSSFFAYHRKLQEIGGFSGISMLNQEVYQAPDERSASDVTIGPGNKVYILDVIGDWYKVQLEDKDVGWIKKERIALI